jgi:hypothetical protein
MLIRANWHLVHQPLALHLLNRQRAAIGIFQLAPVPPERKLIAVAVHVLLADLVEDAVVTALQQREERFGGVGGEAVARVLAFAVVDRLVPPRSPSRWLCRPGFRR